MIQSQREYKEALRGSERDKELQELFEKTRSLYTIIFEMEEKLFAISGIRLPLDHKTGKEYIESIKIKKI